MRFLDRPDDYIEMYARAHQRGDRMLLPAPTRRQFRTAREILLRLQSLQGLLLADDVGLGKTTVAALVTCFVAGTGGRVRILAPSEVMARRWREEVASHLAPLAAVFPNLDKRRALRVGKTVERLRQGSIQVSTHRREQRLACDLLIIDEAHRARGERSLLRQALKSQRRLYGKLLFLTATPFSIRPAALESMLAQVGGEESRSARRACGQYFAHLTRLWRGDLGPDARAFGRQLGGAGLEAIEGIRGFVIRHSVAGLEADEQALFGVRDADSWSIPVETAEPAVLDVLLALDRGLHLARQARVWDRRRRADPRYAIGWRTIRKHARRLSRDLDAAAPSREVALARVWTERVGAHLRSLGVHPKVSATVDAVKAVADRGEKVVVFCHHHATAQEIAEALQHALPGQQAGALGSRSAWRKAWRTALARLGVEKCELSPDDQACLAGFIEWLSSPGVRAQVAGWVGLSARDGAALPAALNGRGIRRRLLNLTIAEEALRLYRRMVDAESQSTRAVLRRIARDGRLGSEAASGTLPGGGVHQTRVVAVCRRPKRLRTAAHEDLFFPDQPDRVMAVFNSPFGPDVLVTTDRLSEGVDLHSWCRHLVHHELDPSPVRTIQRTGRLHRVGSWAGRVKEPLLVAFPAFRGTRDERLVVLMRQRIRQFDLLLGGVRDLVDTDGSDFSAEQNEALSAARVTLGAVDLGVSPKEAQ